MVRLVGEGYRRLVAWCCAHRWRAAMALLVACAPALVMTITFFANVHTGMEELLPRETPSVRALDEIRTRVGGHAMLAIVAHSPDGAANRAFIDALDEALKARAIPEIRTIQSNVRLEREWLKNHAPLLLEKDRFDPLMNDLEQAIERAKIEANPLLVDLDGGDAKARPATSEITERLEREAKRSDRFPDGYLATPDGHTIVVLLWLRGSEVDLKPAEALLTAVKREVDALHPRWPQIKIGYNGDVANLLEEHDAILADLSLSSLVVLILVGGLIIGYFRSVRAVLTVVATIIPGLLFAFAAGRLIVGHLNANTTFLGAIIAGNGINFPLVLLAYYRARSPDEDRVDALVGAARQALPGTLGAAATAAAAYAGLAAATFRGFSQFGWLGGVGLLTTWALTFLVMPIAIALLDPPRFGAQPTRVQRALLRHYDGRRRPIIVAVAFILLAGLGVGLGVRRAAKDGLYEMDLLAMRNRDSLRSGGASWDGKMNEVFGVWLTPVVALVQDPAHREALASQLRGALLSPADPVAERIETIGQLVPPEAEQRSRIERMRKLEAVLARIPREEIPERARTYLDAWFSPANLRLITAEDVPLSLRHGLTEIDGHSDKSIQVYPSLKINYNDARNVLHFSDRLATVQLPEGAVIGGTFLFMAEIIRLIQDEAPRVVLVVCLLVALVLVPIFFRRPARIPLVVLSVAVVAFAAQAMMFAVGVRLNMLNFAAVPITIGVGADYVVNLLGAMDAFNTDARRACARMGGAILLCSLTTTVGYLSLVLAQSGALRTFGWAAVLGELVAVMTVLLVLPVLLPRRAPAPLEKPLAVQVVEG